MNGIGPFEFLIVAFIGLVLLAAVIGIIFHMVVFGKIFGLVTDRIKHQIDQEKQIAKSSDPKPCSYCQATIPQGAVQCPRCGAKRE
jgi:hypothetical protein